MAVLALAPPTSATAAPVVRRRACALIAASYALVVVGELYLSSLLGYATRWNYFGAINDGLWMIPFALSPAASLAGLGSSLALARSGGRDLGLGAAGALGSLAPLMWTIGTYQMLQDFVAP